MSLLSKIVDRKKIKELDELGEGRSPEQRQVILYFRGTGCCLKKAMTDAEYEAMVMKKVQELNIRERAVNKLGIDEDQVKEVEPIHFESWLFDSDRKNWIKMGKDKVWRSSAYQVTWLFFSSEQVYFYQYTLRLADDGKKEQTDEYFYKDITNFSAASESVEKEDVPLKESCGGEITYGRRVVDVDVFRITVPGDKISCAMEQSEYTESAIQGMKAKLREKKGSK